MKRTTALAVIALAAAALAGCTAAPTDATDTPETAVATPASGAASSPEPTPTPEEMPAWAEAMTWYIYPDGFKCAGTEGCPNDYRAFFGEPGPVLPDNVEYYDPGVHDCAVVHPAGMDCFGT